MEGTEGKTGVIYPTFEEYPHRLRPDQIVAFQPDNDELSYTADDLIRFYTAHPIETLLLINPDNPSGNFIPMEGLLRLIEWSKQQGIRLIVDESFVDFSEDFEHNSLLHNDILESYQGLVVMKSISKSYGVPGLRLGVLASSDSAVIQQIKKDVSIWNINSFGEFYMQIFGKYEKDYLQACHRFIAERDRFGKLLRTIPYLRVLPTQANYFCCQVTARYTSAELTKLLLERFNIMAKDCDSKNGLKGNNYIRLSVRSTEDNDRLIEALRTL
jgi:histidinol-phosphate/aromatic aminotransferase/cobyric acid decarboxylase-like protein